MAKAGRRSQPVRANATKKLGPLVPKTYGSLKDPNPRPVTPATAIKERRPAGEVRDDRSSDVVDPPGLSWLRRNRWWLIAIGALTVSRTISILVAFLGGAHHAHLPVWSLPTYQVAGGGVTHGSAGYLSAWDSYWYLDAAQHGWPHVLIPTAQNSTGFFPALPLALRAMHAVSGLNWTVTGFVVEVLLEIGAVLAVSILARRVLGERRGTYAVVLFCMFPGAYVFSQVYSEPLFILTTAICLYGLYRRWWWVAGLGAALAGATRPTAIVLMVCCAWVALREIWMRRNWSSLVAPALSPIGMVAFSLFLLARTGTATAYLLTQQQAFGQTFTTQAIPHELTYFFSAHKPVFAGLGVIGPSYAWVALAFLLWGVIGLGLLGYQLYRRQMPSEWFLFCLGGLVVTLASNHVGFRPRMALVTFPLIFAYASIIKRWWIMVPAVGLCAAGLAFFSYSIPGYVP